MASVSALKVILGASLGLGAIDVAVIDIVLAPAVLEQKPRPAPVAIAAPVVVTPPPPAELPPVIVHETEQVYFATRSAVLDARVRAALDQLAKRGGRFVLEGHADYRGGEVENDKLSELRAKAVADYLAARGIERANIDARHVGESSETSAKELWRDRRVDIQITREALP